jgi:hypothetical protein
MIDLEDIVQLCKGYAHMGWAVQEQLDDVLAGDMTAENVNENALRDIEDWLHDLATLSPELDDAAMIVLDRIADFRDEMANLAEEDR